MPMTRVTRVRPRLRPPVTRRDDVLSDVDHTPPMSMSMGQSASPCRSVTYILLLLYMCTMVQLCTAVQLYRTAVRRSFIQLYILLSPAVWEVGPHDSCRLSAIRSTAR